MLKYFLERGVVLSPFHRCFIISRVLQKLLRYFTGSIISTSTLPAILPLLAAVWPVILVLKLNESVALAPSKSVISPSLFTAGIS